MYKYYICKFMKTDPTLSMSVADVVGYTCIIYSEDELLELPTTILQDYYEIRQLLDEYDCISIELDPITEDEYTKNWKEKKSLYINKRDI